jgi:hypothetical protein
MKRAALGVAAVFVASTISAWAPTSAAGQEEGSDPTTQAEPGELPDLEMYTATVSSEAVAELATEGVDLADVRQVGAEVEVDAVLTEDERGRVAERTGVDFEPAVTAGGLTVSEFAEQEAANGFDVWRSWDEAGGISDEIDQIAAEHPDLVKREVVGETQQGREIVALKLTRNATHVPDGRRPAVLHMSGQHAREWIGVEVNRRLLHWMLDEYEAGNPEVAELMSRTETWFVLVANPDGYQFTFDEERLWRKNLRDNDSDGEITLSDGVDLNRNFDAKWGYDEEGASSALPSQTYRGPAAASEPETVAIQDLVDDLQPNFLANWHSFGQWILYPGGWQVGTLDADNPVYAALAGTDENPAIPGFDPGPSADELYITNGETTDYAAERGTLGFTPELSEGAPGAGFVFPDDEELIQAEFENSLEFALGLSRSARTPQDPESPVGIETEPFYLSQADIDPENGPLSMFDFRFDVSYGDPQDVRVLARDDLRNVTVKYQVNGGRVQRTRASEWDGGERYGPGAANHYRVMQGEVTGTEVGDEVKVWFQSGRHRTEPFTYTVEGNSDNDVLVLASENYTGSGPVYEDPSGPNYLDFYTDALDANDVGHDVYDFDASGRQAPHALGVLSHYDAVVWYTGDNIVTREPGWAAGNASSEAMTELLAVRDFVNEGGRVLYSGKWAGQQFTTGVGSQLYDPFENAECRSDPEVLARCRALHGSGNAMGDVIEYWFGAAMVNSGGGTDPDTGEPFDVSGVDEPFAGQAWSFNGPESAQNQDHSGSLITTSGLLPPEDFPQFESWVAGDFDRPGGPFDPRSGENYVYSNIADVSYKRLTNTVSVPADGASVSFWTSRDTELDWDYFFVEARTAGGDDWTTLEDLNGHTSQDTGESCPAGWRELHAQLDHYQTVAADGTCEPSGTTGEWHAASGGSGGWQEWTVDLSAYAGTDVELSLTYASDWGTQGLGVFVEDIEVSTGEGSTDFEADLGGWEVTGSPPGSAPNANDFERIVGAGFPEGAVVATADTVYMGVGLEGISGAATREEAMASAIEYLLR